jgi:hypothetical protein
LGHSFHGKGLSSLARVKKRATSANQTDRQKEPIGRIGKEQPKELYDRQHIQKNLRDAEGDGECAQ